MPVPVETLTVTLRGQTHPFPTLAFVDRRGRKPWRPKTWVLVRGLERVLYGVRDCGRSTGAFANHLSKCTLADAVLVCDKASVAEETITTEELQAGVVLAPWLALDSTLRLPCVL